MARIRCIKPEFPQSETIGKLSRDARLLFIQLWTIADDEGRGRGAPPVLVGALYPYDEDAPSLIEGWLAELEGCGLITRYAAGGSRYFEISGWRDHQKIDRPTPSRFPAPSGEIAKRRLEVDIEAEIFSGLSAAEEFCGGRILDVQRQVRIGSSYLDIVCKTDRKTFVLEIKKDRISGADVGQVMRYCALIDGIGILVGSGLSPKLTVEECTAGNVAVMTFNNGALTTVVENSDVRERSITFASAIERSATDLGPRIMDLGSRIISDADASDARVDDAPTAHPLGGMTSREAISSDRLAFDRFWQLYPHKVGKQDAAKAFTAAMKRGGVTLEIMLAALDRYIRTKPPDRAYCNPGTWLRQGRWEDEPGPDPTSQRGPARGPSGASQRIAAMADEIAERRERRFPADDPGMRGPDRDAASDRGGDVLPFGGPFASGIR